MSASSDLAGVHAVPSLLHDRWVDGAVGLKHEPCTITFFCHTAFVVEPIMVPVCIGPCLEWSVEPNSKRLELASGTRGHPEQFHIVLLGKVFKGVHTMERCRRLGQECQASS